MSSGQFPIAVGSRPIPVPSSAASPLLSLPPLSPASRARLSGRLLCRKLRGTRSKRRRKSQFISFQAGRAAGDRDSDFPPRSRLPPHSQRGPALMTLENRSLRSLAPLSLVTQSRSANCEIFISPRGPFFLFFSAPASSTASTRGGIRPDFICCRNRNPSYRVINYVARRPRWNKFVDRLATTLITTTRP